jgi:Leucine-rich repeat (LRR) protein
MNHNHILEILPELLKKSTTALASIKHLDFSDMKINRFPSILIPYLSGVTSVCLRNTTPDPTHSDNRLGGIKNHQLLANVLNLPNLQEIDFTNNELSSASIACLIFFMQKSDKKLKKINVTNCLCPRDLFESLVKACSDNNVDIVY